MTIELLDLNHRDAIIEAFKNTNQQIRIISPFVQETMSKYLVDSMSKNITSQMITRFYREDFISAVSSLTALKNLEKSGVEIFAVQELHSKLYLFDDNVAIIGSANFTGGGFGNNIELSLYIEDEYNLIKKLSEYFDKLLYTIQALGDFNITNINIEKESLIVQKAIKGRDHTSKPNPARFGAKIDTKVPVEITFEKVENILDNPDKGISAVLKFEGAAHRRIDPYIKYAPSYYKKRGVYFTAASRSPRSLTTETTIFISAVSKDKSGADIPIVVGRAKTRGYHPSNVTDGAMINEHPWAVDYPYYVELFDIETVDTNIINCISLNNLIAEVGYRLYPNTESDPTTPIPELRTRHHQKAYITITPYAANRINMMLENLFNKYGKVSF